MKQIWGLDLYKNTIFNKLLLILFFAITDIEIRVLLFPLNL